MNWILLVFNIYVYFPHIPSKKIEKNLKINLWCTKICYYCCWKWQFLSQIWWEVFSPLVVTMASLAWLGHLSLGRLSKYFKSPISRIYARHGLIFLIGINSMKYWTAATWSWAKAWSYMKKEQKKRLKHTANLFRKNLKLKDVTITTMGNSPDVTTVFHPRVYDRFIEIQSNLRREKLHRTN